MFDRFVDKLRDRFKKEASAERSPSTEALPRKTLPPASSGASTLTEASSSAALPPVEVNTPPAPPQPEKPGFMTRVWQELNKDVTEVALIGPSMTRLRDGLKNTRDGLMSGMRDLFRLHPRIDEVFWERLEEILIVADVGVQTSVKLIDRMRAVVQEKKISEPADVTAILKDEISSMLSRSAAGLRAAAVPPTVIMVVGVNGSGKTTSIGKLAWQLKNEGKKVMLGAADTFRAAAIDQLGVWADRVGVEMVRHAEGSDPAAVAFDAVSAAKARAADVLIVDTAGRLHSKINLMEEIKKVRRVMRRQMPDAPHEVLLVLDATTGQNALQQARTFGEAVDVTGIVLAKLDGTAKGGIVLAIADELDVPVKFIGLGERLEDLRPFDAQAFLDALFAAD